MQLLAVALLAFAAASSSTALIATSVDSTTGRLERSQPNLLAWSALALAALVVWRSK